MYASTFLGHNHGHGHGHSGHGAHGTASPLVSPLGSMTNVLSHSEGKHCISTRKKE